MRHHHDSHHEHGVPRALLRTLAVTLVFMVVELGGGIYANSLALISDAFHMATDAGAIGLSLFVFKLSQKPSTPRMSFGYRRAEILGALMSGLLVWVLVGAIALESVKRLQDPPEVRGPVVFVIALIGLASNWVGMRFLHHHHEHNLNVRAAYLHLLTDALGSVAAIISGAVIWTTGWRMIDPIITLVFSVLMITSSWSLIKESISVLMESTPSHLDPSEILRSLSGLPGIREVHDLHIWTVSSGRLALSVHLVVEGSVAAHSCLEGANQLLEQKYEIAHTTIQIESTEAFRLERCYDCAHD